MSDWKVPEQIPDEIKNLYRHHHCIYPHPKDDAVEQALDRLVIKLRTAGLLSTEGEKAAQDIMEGQLKAVWNLHDKQKRKLTRLKAKNKRLRGLLRRASEELGWIPDYLRLEIGDALGADSETTKRTNEING